MRLFLIVISFMSFSTFAAWRAGTGQDGCQDFENRDEEQKLRSAAMLIIPSAYEDVGDELYCSFATKTNEVAQELQQHLESKGIRDSKVGKKSVYIRFSFKNVEEAKNFIDQVSLFETIDPPEMINKMKKKFSNLVNLAEEKKRNPGF